jgi:type I restriction enzyme, R subunit
VFQRDLWAGRDAGAGEPGEVVLAERLRAAMERLNPGISKEAVEGAVEELVRDRSALNPVHAKRLQALIDAYNAGAMNVQVHFEKLVAFAKALDEEEQRAIASGLTEEELAVFDLLTKPGPRLMGKEEEQVRTAARELLAALKRGKLVLDWRKKQAAKAQVQVTIQRTLAERLPRAYSLVEMRQKSDVVYQHVYDAYWGEGRSLYAAADSARATYRAE